VSGWPKRYRPALVGFWALAFAIIAALCVFQPPPPGWDLHVYANAVRSLRAGHDPYADGIAVQQIFHNQLALHPDAMPPYTYVYSPLTLPLLRIIGRLPLGLVAAVYWVVYAAGLLSAVLMGLMFAEPEEIRILSLLAPAAVFLPGLLESNALLSGNLAYILYGLIFTSALAGWRRGDWRWFYGVTLLASCFKAPLLSLLAIPVLSARRQWLSASLAAIAGVLLFAVQPRLWPSAFHSYLQAVALQFSYNHDFGVSPAGLVGNAMFGLGRPYSSASTWCYLIYAPAVFGALLYLSRRFLAGLISLQRWVPVMLLGVVLLDPRIKEYDVAPLTLPMAMIGWRLIRRIHVSTRPVLTAALLYCAVNVAAFRSDSFWKVAEGLLLVGLFTAGYLDLLRRGVDLPAQPGVSVPLAA
jgi:hypothetical protein